MLRFVVLFFMAVLTSIVGRAQNDVAIQNENNDVANNVESVDNPRRAAATLPYDVNGDGVVNVVDVVDVVKFINGCPRSGITLAKADVNGDGVVNEADVDAISNTSVANTPPAGDQGEIEPPINDGKLRGSALANPVLPK